jgi:hypothetical protein
MCPSMVTVCHIVNLSPRPSGPHPQEHARATRAADRPQQHDPLRAVNVSLARFAKRQGRCDNPLEKASDCLQVGCQSHRLLQTWLVDAFSSGHPSTWGSTLGRAQRNGPSAARATCHAQQPTSVRVVHTRRQQASSCAFRAFFQAHFIVPATLSGADVLTVNNKVTELYSRSAIARAG